MMNLNYDSTIGRTSSKWGRQNEKTTVSKNAGASAASNVKDQMVSAEGAIRKDSGFVSNPDEALKDTVRKLLKAYPNIDITYGVLNDNDAIRRYAASAGGGFHITVSRDFLDWMSSDPQSFQDGKEFLDQVLQKMREEYSAALAQGKQPFGIGAVIGENGEIDVWTSYPEEDTKKQENPYQWILDTLKANKEAEKTQMQQKKNKIVIKKKPCYSARRDLSMLAKVSTVQDVRGLISQVNSRASSLKLGADAYEKAEVKRAIAQMENVVSKAKIKIKKLKEESISQQRQKKLIAEQKRKEALQEKIMLNRRKAARHAREHTQVCQSIAEEMQERNAEAAEASSAIPMVATGVDAMAGTVAVDIASVGVGAVSTAVSTGADVAVAVQSMDVSI